LLDDAPGGSLQIRLNLDHIRVSPTRVERQRFM
jgi:hypothetical protein